MDPNATLRDIRQMVKDLAASKNTDHMLDLGDDLASAITQLDEWITTGGFLPHDWQEVN